MSTNGFSRNLGGLSVSSWDVGGGSPSKKEPGLGSAPHARYPGSELKHVDVVPNVKETPETSGTGREKSERPDSTSEAGERVLPDPVEGSGASSYGLSKGKATGMSGSELVSTRLRQIAKLAMDAPDMAFTSLNKHLDFEWLMEAYRRTRKDGATGVDGQSAQEYEVDLEGNLRDLLERAKSGSYRAPPVRRVHIPKGKGKGTRPLGIPTFEDKILQRAVVMLLEPIYEPLFLDFSYAFRPGKSAHGALDQLWHESMNTGGGWIVELDIKSYFDAIPHAQLREILRKRVRDGVLLRLIGKWLNAGVMEDGRVHRPKSGSPQGGVISPILSNIFLHEVLDEWFVEEVRPRLEGRGFLIRFADDAVLGFTSWKDARRVLDVLPKRFEKYGLTLHPEKTRMVRFRRPGPDRGQGGTNDPGTFDFLGFTHYWGKSRNGKTVIKRKTAKDRMSRAMTKFNDYCRRIRHLPMMEQCRNLGRRLQGHFNYYGISGNAARLREVSSRVCKAWHKWLNRRSQKRSLNWEKFLAFLRRNPLPKPRIVKGPTLGYVT
jgi:group II intron reverse transcriptase/maturase